MRRLAALQSAIEFLAREAVASASKKLTDILLLLNYTIRNSLDQDKSPNSSEFF